jgi:hypothetical protein
MRNTFLLTFETALFFCVCPIYMIVGNSSLANVYNSTTYRTKVCNVNMVIRIGSNFNIYEKMAMLK